MGCHILHDRDANHAVLFCSTTDWCFGPVFGDGDDGHDAQERAEAFLRWLETAETWGGYDKSVVVGGRRDPRVLTEEGLQQAYADWQAQEATQWAREEALVFDDQEDSHGDVLR